MRTRVTSAREPAVDARFCLMFPRETISVPVVRRVLGETLDRIGVDEDCIADLLLAVTEACTNVLKHSGPGFRYEVTASVGPHTCVLEVVDTGRGFGRAAQRGGAGAGPAARVRPRSGHHARLRRRCDPAQPPGPGDRRVPAEADRTAQRRAARSSRKRRRAGARHADAPRRRLSRLSHSGAHTVAADLTGADGVMIRWIARRCDDKSAAIMNADRGVDASAAWGR